jgi:hypothetical protein
MQTLIPRILGCFYIKNIRDVIVGCNLREELA